MTRAEEFVAGMQIILKYDPNADYASEHDIFWFGKSDIPVTDEEKALLEKYGWHIDERYDCWLHYT